MTEEIETLRFICQNIQDQLKVISIHLQNQITQLNKRVNQLWEQVEKKQKEGVSSSQQPTNKLVGLSLNSGEKSR